MQDKREASAWLPSLIIGGLFFIFGFVTWLNGPLITFVKLAFRLNDVNALLVPMAFYLSYLLLALPSAWVLHRTGMKRGMGLGLLTMAVGAALFGEAATRRVYPAVLAGLFTMGAGLALLQTAVNPYISLLGPIDSGARRIAVMGICNKFAGMLAPIVIGALVLHGIDDLDLKVRAASPGMREHILDAFAAKVHLPYLAMAVLLALLGIGVVYSPLPDLDTSTNVSKPTTGAGSATAQRSLFSYPHLWLGALCLFLYVGVEVMAADAIGIYGSGFQLPPAQTIFFTSFTLAAMLLGYLLGLALIPRYISQQRYLAFSAMLGALLSIAAYLSSGYVSVGFVAALGLANAMMWPSIFPLAIRALGVHTEAGSAWLVMGICGGAILPGLYAQLKLALDFQLAFLLLILPAYLYILFYGWLGHRIGLTAVRSRPDPYRQPE